MHGGRGGKGRGEGGESLPCHKGETKARAVHPVGSQKLPRGVATFLPLHRLLSLPGIFFLGHSVLVLCSGQCMGVTSSGTLPGWRARSGPDTLAQ